MELNNDKTLAEKLDMNNLKRHQQQDPAKREQTQMEIVLARINALEEETQQQREEIKDLEFRITINENMTKNGNLNWKIHNVSERTQLVIDNKVRAINSAPCFTSQYGYKYCIRVYPTGDGMGKGTHLSLFLVLLKSEYDATLQWPFTKKMVVTLINQEDRAKDLVQVLVPDSTNPSFQKPKNETNLASGFPEFVALEKLKDGFLKDDALFIDVRFLDD